MSKPRTATDELVKIGTIVAALIVSEAHTVTRFLTPKLRIRVTRELHRGKIDRRNKSVDVRVTIGKPNYIERQYVKDLLAAGVPFPVKRSWIKYPAKRRK